MDYSFGASAFHRYSLSSFQEKRKLKIDFSFFSLGGNGILPAFRKVDAWPDKW